MRALRWISVLPIIFFLQLNTCGQVDPEPLEPGLLTVVVEDGQGVALGEASIFIDGAEQSRTAVFELEALVAYEVSVVLEGWTFIPESQSVTLNPGQERALTFTGTAETAELNVTAVDPFGEPVEGPVLWVNGVEQGNVPGTFTLGAGLELSLSLAWDRWSFEPAETTVVLQPGTAEEIVFRGRDLERVVLIEDFKNSDCYPGCVQAEEAIEQALASLDGMVVPIAWHLFWPNGRDSLYLYNVAANRERHMFYGQFYNLPPVYADGGVVATPTDPAEITASLEPRLVLDRKVSMKLSGAWNGPDWEFTLTGKVHEDPGPGPWRAYVVIYEDVVYWNGGHPDFHGTWHGPVRHIDGEDEPPLGQALDLTAGESFIVTSSFAPNFDFPNVPPVQENLRAIAFIQHDGSQEVLDAVLENTGGP